MLTLRGEKGSPLTHEEMDSNFKRLLLFMCAMYEFSPEASTSIVDYLESEPEAISLPLALQRNFVFNGGSGDVSSIGIHALPLGLESITCNVTFKTIGAWANMYVACIYKGMLIIRALQDDEPTSKLPTDKQCFFILTGGVSSLENSPAQVDYTLTGSFETLA